MTVSDPLPPAVTDRKAIVYVRQSTQAQVEANTESRRRQYELVQLARHRGFRTVEVIDDDLGLSASGMVARPGFERLVAALCAGEVGAVLCFDASRLARNGRDWHHLLELCGLVEARVIDLDGIYDPCLPNDRLLLGMKGSISEFELGVIRARMLDAARAKARRGELRISVPVGYVWHRETGVDLDPDLRLQEVIRLVFRTLPPTGQRAAGTSVACRRGRGLPAALRRRAHRRLRLDADPLPQRDRAVEEPLLCGHLRLRQKREAHRGRRGAGTEVLRAPQAPRGLGRGDRRSSRGLHRQGRVRSQPGDAGGQRPWPLRRAEVRPRRPGAPVGHADLGTMRARAGRGVYGPGAGAADLPLRPPQPNARTAALSELSRGTLASGATARV